MVSVSEIKNTSWATGSSFSIEDEEILSYPSLEGIVGLLPVALAACACSIRGGKDGIGWGVWISIAEFESVR